LWTGIAESATHGRREVNANTAIATHESRAGTERTGSRASSARFDTVSMPVYAIIATGIASAKFDQVGAVAEMDVRRDDVRREDQHEPEPDEQQLRRKVEHVEQHVEVRRLLDPDDVDADEQPGEQDPDDHVPRRRAQRLPEDREGSAARRSPRSRTVITLV